VRFRKKVEGAHPQSIAGPAVWGVALRFTAPARLGDGARSFLDYGPVVPQTPASPTRNRHWAPVKLAVGH